MGLHKKHLSLSGRDDESRRLNAVCPYYTMFPLEFPLRQLIRAQPGEWVLDPFCGRGTTSFAARLLRLPSIGIDSNPVAVAIAASKFVNAKEDAVIRLGKQLLAKKRQPQDVPHSKFWSRCYHPSTLEEICKIREELLEDCATEERIALRAIMLGILHGPRQKVVPSYLSNQMPRTYATKPNPAITYWSKHKLYPTRINVLEVIARRAKYLLAKLPPKVKGQVIQADSKLIPLQLVSERFGWVVTSPPYLGMRTYVPDQWLRNWFLGGPATVDYAQSEQLGHHAEDEFVNGLSKVWRRISPMCLPGARLVVRFGTLPSIQTEPSALLKKSLDQADCGWRVRTIKRAGLASQGKRQADQFGHSTGAAVEEVDLYAVLEG